MLRSQYIDQGFVVVRDLFTIAEIVEVSVDANRLLERKELVDFNNLRCRWLNHYETDRFRFDCFDPVIDLSPAINKLARDPRLLELLAELHGEEVCLFKDKLIYKPPGAMGYGLHRLEQFP